MGVRTQAPAPPPLPRTTTPTIYLPGFSPSLQGEGPAPCRALPRPSPTCSSSVRGSSARGCSGSSCSTAANSLSCSSSGTCQSGQESQDPMCSRTHSTG